MHHLYYLAAFPATGMAILGYVALYCARNSEGRMRTVGKILAGLAFLLVLLVVAVVVFHPAMGGPPFGPRGHFGQMGDGSTMDGLAPGAQSASPPASVAPTPPTPATPSSPSGWKTE